MVEIYSLIWNNFKHFKAANFIQTIFEVLVLAMVLVSVPNSSPGRGIDPEVCCMQ